MNDMVTIGIELGYCIRLYSTGLACGIVLSLLPYVVGSLVHFALKTMKGG